MQGLDALAKEIRLLATSAILGYGFPEASLMAGLERQPQVIGVDGGSVDPGPHYLGSGKPFCSAIAIRRDLRLMLNAAVRAGISVVIGTCGGAGGAPHLELVATMAREIAREDGLHFKMTLIEAEQDKASLNRRVAAGRVRPLARQRALTNATIDRATRIVAMMGPEPFTRALDGGAQVVLAGRASDPASGPRPPPALGCPRPRPGMPERCWNAARPRRFRKAMTACLSRCERIMSNASRPIRRGGARRCRSPTTRCTKTAVRSIISNRAGFWTRRIVVSRP
ncbi:MAG: acyclic terpene utilization AtuA family protein [Rhodopila sp.]|jgi:hypothetical protein